MSGMRVILLFVLSIYCSSLFSASSGNAIEDFEKTKPSEGERCLICKVPLTDNDVTLIVRGRRVPLKQAMLDSFMDNQEHYFARMQPKGALFQENLDTPAGVAQGGIQMGWFLFGCYILAGLIFGGASSYLAVSKGLPSRTYFLAGFFLNLLGLLFTITRPASAGKTAIPPGFKKVPDTAEPVFCKSCGNGNHPTARACSRCNTALNPSQKSEVERI